MKHENTRFRVVMCGPMPPAIGGMASVIGGLAESKLHQKTDLVLFDTGKKTAADRSIFEGIQARLKLMVQWRSVLAKRPLGIAHIHTCSGFTFFLDGLLSEIAKWQGYNVVMHVHGARFDQFLDELNPVLRGIAKLISKRADIVIALSEDWRNRLKERLPKSRILVLANGVPEPRHFHSLEESTETTFLFLGNLGKRKGVPVLLDAMALAKEHWVVLIAGGEEDAGFADWTQAEIAKRHLSTRAIFLGPVVGEAKDRLWSQADAFVLPSLAEGLPMSLLEAMAAQLPVVVTSVGAMPEVITDGVEGYLVAPGEAAPLAKAMDRLAKEPKKRETMGNEGFAKYQAQYSVDAMAQALLEIYESEFDPTFKRNALSNAASTDTHNQIS